MFESGYRIHSTQFEWPKNMFPSNFAMKVLYQTKFLSRPLRQRIVRAIISYIMQKKCTLEFTQAVMGLRRGVELEALTATSPHSDAQTPEGTSTREYRVTRHRSHRRHAVRQRRSRLPRHRRTLRQGKYLIVRYLGGAIYYPIPVIH